MPELDCKGMPRVVMGVCLVLMLGFTGSYSFAEVFYQQTFTNNADGDADAALDDYGVACYGGSEANDLRGTRVVRHEESRGKTDVGDVRAASPHKDVSLPDMGMVRTALPPNDPLIMYVEFDGQVVRGGQHPNPMVVSDATSLAWQMNLENKSHPYVQVSVRRGQQWYVRVHGEVTSEPKQHYRVDLLDESAQWRRLSLSPEKQLALVGKPLSWSKIRGAITGIGIFANNEGEAGQTIRTDNWRLAGEGVAFEASVIKPVEKIETLGPLPHEQRVGPADGYSTFGIYGASPESPDGTRILYTVLDANELSDYDDKARGALYLCDADLSNHRHLRDIEFPVRVHNGAFQQWVDDDSIAYSGGGHFAGDVYVVNAETGETEWGPYTGAMLGDNNHGSIILINVWSPESNVGPQGLYELDTRDGKLKFIASTHKISEVYNDQWNDGTDDPRGWLTTHAKFSTDGSHIAFTVSTNNIFDRSYGKYGNTRSQQHLFTLRRDGSDLRLWGIDKPMHFDWFDEDTVWGADDGVNGERDKNTPYIMKRWDRDKKMVEVLAGPGCHVAVSPDGKWFAGETWYRSNPVVLRLYRRGQMEPSRIIFKHPFSQITWVKHTAHVNPAFGRDNKYLYYKRAISEKTIQTFRVEIVQD